MKYNIFALSIVLVFLFIPHTLAAKRRYFKFGGNWKSWRGDPFEEDNSLSKNRPVFGRRSLPDQYTVHSENRDVEENAQIELTCGVDPDRYPNIRWSRYGQPLPLNAREQDGKIIFQSTQLGDAGTYVCSASNDWDTKEIHIRLTVHPSDRIREQAGTISHCRHDQATCGSGECIDRSHLCDGDVDCRDGSDERSCGGRSSLSGECEPNEYKCNNARCIQRMWVCDGDDDCGDRSDENNCGQRQPGEQCAPYEFKCHSQNQCVPLAYQCDKNNDCFDGSDEVGCTGPTAVEAPPRDVTVRCGETVVLTCRTIGVPVPYVNWRLNWGPVCNPPRCTQTSSNGVGTLTIRNAQDSDQGAYTCEAVNVVNRILVSPDSIVRVDCGKPFGERNCDPRGSEISLDDGTGRCQCKQLATGPRCEQCVEGSFYLSENNQQGCIRCFCSGITRVCQSSSWYRTQERLFFTLDNQNVSLSDREKSTPIVDFDLSSHRGFITHSNPHVGTLYWHLPPKMLGNKVTAYGGQLKFSFQFAGSGDSDTKPLIILKGRELTAVYSGQPTYNAGGIENVTVDIRETAWAREDGQAMTREHFLMLLSKLDSFMIRATHVSQHTSTSLGEVNLDIALARDTQQERAMAVEECRCPDGYQGLSCEECAPGYERSGGGLYLGTCIRKSDFVTTPIKIEPKIQEDNEGGSVTFRAVAEGDTGLPGSGYVYTWTRDGYPQLPENAIVEGNTLKISDLRIEDRGTYKVTISTPDGGAASGEAELKVNRVGVCPYLWIEPIKTWRGQPGERVEFHCKAIGEPTPKLYWLKADGRPLDLNSRDRGDGTLIIERVDPRNYGQYTCHGENRAGKNTANATVAEGGPVDKSITVRIEPSNTIASKRYDTVYVRCVATGTPKPTITWSREDGSPLHSNAQDQGNGILRFLSMDKINAGLYRCMARNRYTHASDIANILAPIDIRSVPPFVVVDPRELEAQAGREVKVACAAVVDNRDPSPRLVWTRQGGKPLDNNITDQGDGYLYIENFKSQHVGTYECTAVGVHSKAIGTAKLRLKEESSGQAPPVPEVSPKIQTVVEGDHVEFKCQAEGTPAPTLTWAFNSATGALASNAIQDDGRLIIHRSEYSTNEGQYFCTASNNYGSNTASGTLYIEKVPTLPKIEITPQKQWSGKFGSDFKFKCIAKGHPKPKVIWSRADKKEIGENVKIDEEGRLMFTNAQYADSGEYICTANNAAGEVQDTVFLDIKPDISAKIVHKGKEIDGVLNVEEDSPLKLECLGTGDVQLKGRWNVDIGPSRGDVPEDYKPVQVHSQYLMHDSIKQSNSGTFNCIVSNELGRSENAIKIQVTPRKRHFAAVLGANEQIVLTGTRLQLRCLLINKNTKFSLGWVRKAPTGAHMPMEHEIPEEGFLVIPEFDDDDAGTYECQVKDVDSDQIIDTEEVRIISSDIKADIKASTKIKVEGGPIKHVMVGEKLDLKCNGADPSDSGHSELRWSLTTPTASEATRNPKWTVLDGSLHLSNITLHDAGIYTCTYYVNGQRESSYHVATVVSNTETTAKQSQPEIGLPLELQCPLFHIPGMTYEWSRVSGAFLPDDIRVDERSLRIPNFNADYAGTYECLAIVDGKLAKGYVQVAPFGMDKLAAILRPLIPVISDSLVTETPTTASQTQSFSRPYMELKLDVMPDFAFPGKDVTLRCIVDAEPKAHIRWERIGRPLPRTSYVSGHHLKLRKLHAGDIGRYRCTASTSIGPITIETVVKIGEKLSGNVIRRYYDF